MIVPEITDHPQEPAVPIAAAAPTRPRSRLLDRLRHGPLRGIFTTGARRASTGAGHAARTTGRAAHDAVRHHRRAADEHMRDNAAQINPLGLR